ncbi:MAG: prepilin-type N-terminal cleavage/methylation domain-containing protein [Chitinispirillaceae bacterium]|nr:prepilin-type N-terminal cleavage/methylation domain-containing protein [Chitinispirillaceae bacterium]
MINNRAFTLIEILVAIMLFSLLLLPLTALLIAESKFEKRHEQKMIALLIAGNEIEKSKRAFGECEGEEYTVTMAGFRWDVERIVETEEGAIVDTGSAVVKQSLVTIRVRREDDTVTLADLRVLRETYR